MYVIRTTLVAVLFSGTLVTTALTAPDEKAMDNMAPIGCAFNLDRQFQIDSCKRLLARNLWEKNDRDWIYNNMGNAYLELRRYKIAAAHYSKAIELNPSSPIAYANRGYVYLELRQYKKASADFNRQLAIKWEHPAAHYGLGLVYLAEKKFSKALEAFGVSALLSPINAANAYRYAAIGVAYQKLGELGLATQAFEAALQLDPNDATSKEGLTKIGVM